MIYAYGDSFTYGTGIRANMTQSGKKLEAFVGSDQWSDYTWVKELKRSTGHKIENKGIGGITNDFILYFVTKDLPVFKPKDIIILGGTKSMRMMMPVGNGTEDYSTLLSIQHDVLEWKWKDAGKGLYEYDGWLVEKSLVDSIIPYYYEVFPKYERLYDKMFKDQYLGLCKYLNSTGRTCIYWDASLWVEFEQIHEWSRNHCKDGHWSPNGHLYFARILKYCIDNSITVLNKDVLFDIKSKVPQAKHYVEYNVGLI